MKKRLILFFIIIMLGAAAQAQYVAQDPTTYIPNGRVLGLGKAYIGLADDTGALYTNPAGLAGMAGWQLSSMSGKFLDEYSFLSFSGAYPTDYGVLGFGFAGTSISGAFATTVEAGSDPADPIYVIDPNQSQMGNYNNAFILSYANQLSKIEYLKTTIPQADKISLGVSLKLFQVALYGDGIVGGDATGMDMDLGIKYQPPLKWITVGATLQNFLPVGLGGKLTYASGHEEAYPASLKLGSAFTVLGRQNALKEYGEQELKLMMDMDYHPVNGYPIVMHTGAEWKPVPYIAIRAGIDQDASGDGNGGLTTIADMAYGVGLYYGGFRFDYAYHTFAGAPNVDNHFFSLSYSFIPPAEIKEKMIVNEPKDKLITFDDKVNLSGTVLDQNIRELKAGTTPVRFGLNGDFTSSISLNEGKNRNDLSAYDRAGKLLQVNNLRALRLIKFPDVEIGYWVEQPISLLAMAKVITGYPDGTFRPAGDITRAEMCTLLMKTRAQVITEEATISTPEASSAFKDVQSKHWASSFIAQAAQLGVVKGYPDGTFRPAGNITRAEGLAMIARFAGITEEAYSDQFSDVRASNWAAGIIAGAQAKGILKYLEGKPFEPNLKLSRAETVEMLQRTTTVQDLLNKDLLNWDSY